MIGGRRAGGGRRLTTVPEGRTSIDSTLTPAGGSFAGGRAFAACVPAPTVAFSATLTAPRWRADAACLVAATIRARGRADRSAPCLLPSPGMSPPFPGAIPTVRWPKG